MARCGSCGAETPRVRTIFEIDGKRLPHPKDECPNCSPEGFEVIKDPSTTKMWIGPEYNPNAYEKRYDKDGVYYVAKPEFTAEQEAKVSQPATDEVERQAMMERKKRSERRTRPLDMLETQYALRKAEEIAQGIVESAKDAQQEAWEAEVNAWTMKPTGNA